MESQRAAERIASIEASARQQEQFVEQIASAKVQSAFDELNKESRAWLNSEQAQQQVSTQQMNVEILRTTAQCFSQEVLAIQQVRQEADSMHNERVAELTLGASMKFQAQEVHSCALRDELRRLESELARGVSDRAAVNFVSDPQSAIVMLHQELR